MAYNEVYFKVLSSIYWLCKNKMARDLHDGSWILVYVKHFDARSPGTERKMVSVWQMLFSKN